MCVKYASKLAGVLSAAFSAPRILLRACSARFSKWVAVDNSIISARLTGVKKRFVEKTSIGWLIVEYDAGFLLTFAVNSI